MRYAWPVASQILPSIISSFFRRMYAERDEESGLDLTHAVFGERGTQGAGFQEGLLHGRNLLTLCDRAMRQSPLAPIEENVLSRGTHLG